jgi:hypothetical protein
MYLEQAKTNTSKRIYQEALTDKRATSQMKALAKIKTVLPNLALR